MLKAKAPEAVKKKSNAYTTILSKSRYCVSAEDQNVGGCLRFTDHSTMPTEGRY